MKRKEKMTELLWKWKACSININKWICETKISLKLQIKKKKLMQKGWSIWTPTQFAMRAMGAPDFSLLKMTFPLSKISKLTFQVLSRLCAICNMTSAPLCPSTDGITNERWKVLFWQLFQKPTNSFLWSKAPPPSLISRELHLIHNPKTLLLPVDLLIAAAKWQDVESHAEENIYFDSEGKGIKRTLY